MVTGTLLQGSGNSPAIVVGKFTLDGTNNPSVLSEELESVTRITADTSSLALYRVKFKKDFAPGNQRKEQRGSIFHDGSARRSVEVISGALVSTVAADQYLEVDVGVVSGGSVVNNLTGPVVSVAIYMENQ